MININPFLCTDGYKVSHHLMYPKGTTLVYSNFTPRSGKHSNVEGSNGVISFGQQMIMMQIQEMFDKNFFRWNLQPSGKRTRVSKFKKEVCDEIKREYSMYLGCDYDVSHIEALWDLGFLPIEVKALPEGTFVPYGVPVLTIKNTLPEFYWLTNFLETLISNLLWMPMTAATTAFDYKKTLIDAARKTDKDNIGFVDFQGHNFAMRGMSGLDSTMYAGLGHATSFLGDDGLPTIYGARKYYGEAGAVVHSVNATEHSVMCAGTKGDEIGTFRYLMNTFPKGILSVVSDTWDLWKVITEYLPELKEEILSRDGKLVIRPDSGDPVDIICGLVEFKGGGHYNKDGKLIGYYDHNNNYKYTSIKNSPEYKGVIELLWDIFGGTVNEQGYKVLDQHIGAIYGDSITPKRAKQICERLEAKGFASTNVVLGIGSYTYQYVTRDTHGLACKATYVEVQEQSGRNKVTVGREIFKDPVTDDGTKKSAKGLLTVLPVFVNGSKIPSTYLLDDQVSWEDENRGALQTIFKNGELQNITTLTEIRSRLNSLRYEKI